MHIKIIKQVVLLLSQGCDRIRKAEDNKNHAAPSTTQKVLYVTFKNIGTNMKFDFRVH